MAPQPNEQGQPESLAPGAYGSFNPPPGGSGGGSGRTGVSEGYIPPPRKGQTAQSGITLPDGSPRSFYNLNTEPGEELNRLDEKTLRNFVNVMYSRGWYGNKKPGGGLSDNDREAMANIMYVANLKGRTWQEVWSQVAQAPISTGDGGGGRTRVTATEDLVEVANRTALSTIGRKLTPEEASKFAQAYQGSQRTDAMGGAEAASADVYFQNRIQNQYGAESDGYKYLSAIGNVAKLMESI